VIADHYIDENDMCLVRLCTSTEEAAGEIDHFFSNYVSFDVRGDRATSRFADVQRSATRGARDAVPRFAQGLGYVLEERPTISFAFDGATT